MKKTVFILLAIVAAVLYFDIDTLVLTEQIKSLFCGEQAAKAPPTVGEITPSTLVLSGKTVNLGDSADTVLDVFGESCDSFASEYGFTWNTYHKDYDDYIQIGFNSNGTVCAIYTNAAGFKLSEIGVGSLMDEVRMMFGEPLDSIRKGNTIYKLNCGTDGRREMDVFYFNDAYIRFFYDCFKNNTVTAVHIIEKDTEIGFARHYGEPTANAAQAMELENFHVTNALRKREGKKPVKFSIAVQPAARAHAEEMAFNNYFSHTDLSGGSAFDRVRSLGLLVSSVAENLAAGGQSGIIMHELLMNSQGHRNNILGDYEYLSVGVAFESEDRPYLVQNYFNTPEFSVE